MGRSVPLPPWLPTRPLLVAYIATRGLLGEFSKVLESIDSTDGWHFLLDRIFERESKISPNLNGPTLRRILERLATVARSTRDGLGPIAQQQIRAAYIQICDSEPDEQANLLLQRLPGLGVYGDEDDTRTFVDLELAEVCRARDIADFVLDPYGRLQDEGWRVSMTTAGAFAGSTAVARVSRDLRDRKDFADAQIGVAMQATEQHRDLGALRGDLAALAIESEHAIACETIIEGEVFENYLLSLPQGANNLSKLIFRDCLFESMELGGSNTNDLLPRFQGCVFLAIRGRTGRTDLPQDKFDSRCTFEKFSDSAETQAAILSSNLTRGEKLVLTILRKLFVQSLSGRADSAMSRGLDLNDRQLVPDAIKILTQHGFVALYSRGDGNVWIPIRKELNRARRMLASPTTCNEDVLREARSLGK